MIEADYDEYVFPESWWDLRGDDVRAAGQRAGLADELLTELGSHHELSGADVEAVAMFERQDEALFRVDGQFVIAHLTWAGREDRFVGVRRFPDWAATAAEVQVMEDTW